MSLPILLTIPNQSHFPEGGMPHSTASSIAQSFDQPATSSDQTGRGIFGVDQLKWSTSSPHLKILRSSLCLFLCRQQGMCALKLAAIILSGVLKQARAKPSKRSLPRCLLTELSRHLRRDVASHV